MCVYYIMDMFKGFMGSTAPAEGCEDITKLGQEINANIDIISSYFLTDNGFISILQRRLREIQSKIEEFKKGQTVIQKINDNLQSDTPDCKKALDDLNALKQLISEKDSRIAELEEMVQRLRNALVKNKSQNDIVKIQNDCKETCTNILKGINERLKDVVQNFGASQDNINNLLNSISTALSSSNGSASNSNEPGNVQQKVNVIEAKINPQSSFFNKPSTQPVSPLEDPLTPPLVNTKDNDYVFKGKGGYYYPTSTSSKRNKKSVGRRKKHKRNNKTRR